MECLHSFTASLFVNILLLLYSTTLTDLLRGENPERYITNIPRENTHIWQVSGNFNNGGGYRTSGLKSKIFGQQGMNSIDNKNCMCALFDSHITIMIHVSYNSITTTCGFHSLFHFATSTCLAKRQWCTEPEKVPVERGIHLS